MHSHWDTPAPPLTFLDPPHHLQVFFRDALKALQQQRHTVLNAGQLLQSAEVGNPIIHAAAMDLWHLLAHSVQHNVLQTRMKQAGLRDGNEKLRTTNATLNDFRCFMI